MTLASFIAERRAYPEAWSYTTLEGLEKKAYGVHSTRAIRAKAESAVACDGARPRLVIRNGGLDREASTLKGLPDGFIKEKEDGGLILTLADQMCLAPAPVELLFIHDAFDAPTEATVSIDIVMGANSRMTLIERHDGGAEILSCQKIRIHLAARAKLVHARFYLGAVTQLVRADARLGDGAFYDGFGLFASAALTRVEQETLLEGDGAQAIMRAAMLLGGTAQADLVSRMVHAASNGTSRQKIKAVVNDKARGAFQGRIIVKSGAQKTDARQDSAALLLSDQAEMNARPELEIDADDVACGHGNTAGCLDDESLFYLQARGIPEAQARTMLTAAFVEELVQEVSNAALRDEAKALMEPFFLGSL